MAEGAAAKAAAEAVARSSYGKLVAFLAAMLRDVAVAEEALAEAFAAALVDWPRQGCPANPEAWLLAVARRKAIDALRRRRTTEAASGQLRLAAEALEAAEPDHAIPDRRLALLFVCAHPAIDETVRAPLMLQTVLGLEASRIASAWLTSPAAMSKRLVRAKAKIRDAGVPFRVPEPDELAPRLAAVLDAIYASFSEGWCDPGGTDLARRDLTVEALFLARLTAELLPREPETLGLLALLLHAEARRPARRDARGEYVPFSEQDPVLWEWRRIAEAESLLRKAARLRRPGRYQIEAALQSAHVERRRTGAANWEEVLQLYDALAGLTGSPVVAINRALALAAVEGDEAGLGALAALGDDPRLATYQPLWAARAELLARVGALERAREAYGVAIGLERDPAVRRFLQRRQAAFPAR